MGNARKIVTGAHRVDHRLSDCRSSGGGGLLLPPLPPAAACRLSVLRSGSGLSGTARRGGGGRRRHGAGQAQFLPHPEDARLRVQPIGRSQAGNTHAVHLRNAREGIPRTHGVRCRLRSRCHRSGSRLILSHGCDGFCPGLCRACNRSRHCRRRKAQILPEAEDARLRIQSIGSSQTGNTHAVLLSNARERIPRAHGVHPGLLRRHNRCCRSSRRLILRNRRNGSGRSSGSRRGRRRHRGDRCRRRRFGCFLPPLPPAALPGLSRRCQSGILGRGLTTALHFCQFVQSDVIPQTRGAAVPIKGLGITLPHTRAHGIAACQVALGLRVILLSSLPKQAGGLAHITIYADAPGIMASQGTLGIRLPLLGRFAVPLRGLVGALAHTIATLIAIAEVVLSQGKALFSRTAEPLRPFCGVGRHALAITQAVPQAVLSLSVSLLCGFAVPLGSHGFIADDPLPLIITSAKVELSLHLPIACRTPGGGLAGAQGQRQQTETC